MPMPLGYGEVAELPRRWSLGAAIRRAAIDLAAVGALVLIVSLLAICVGGGR